MLEPFARQCKYELLHLDDGWQVRAEHAPRIHDVMQRAERPPRLRQVQHAPVEAIVIGSNFLDEVTLFSAPLLDPIPQA